MFRRFLLAAIIAALATAMLSVATVSADTRGDSRDPVVRSHCEAYLHLLPIDRPERCRGF